LQNHFVGGEEQAVAGSVGEELDPRSGLTLIGLEEQRQRKGFRYQRLRGGSRLWPAGFRGMYSSRKIERDARDVESSE